jgi:hypothetical protein
MQRPCLKTGEDAILAVENRLYSGIIGQHREDNIAIRSDLPGRGAELCAGRDQGSSFLWRSVPNRNMVTGPHNIGCDGRAHLSKAGKSNF